MFPVARAVLLSMRERDDFGCAENCLLREQVKRDCCHTPAVVSTLLTPLPVSCPLTTPHHYIKTVTLLVHAELFWCFHNPSNSDRDYKIFNMSICVHTGDLSL